MSRISGSVSDIYNHTGKRIAMPIPQNYAAPAKVSAKDRAYNQIQEWIVDGTLVANEKINDAQLANALGISRTPVREALQLLALQGLVAMKPGVATYVTELEEGAIEKILPPLSVLQALAAQTASQMADEADLVELADDNARFADAIKNKDYFNALKEDERFHGKIVQICNNPYLESSINVLQAHVRRLFFQNQIILSEESVDEHNAIIEALKLRQADKASEIAKKNWQRSVDNMY